MAAIPQAHGAVAVDVELQLAVENLLARYAHALDDDRLEEWPDFFVE